MGISLKRFLLNFKSLFGITAVVLGAIPVASTVLPDSLGVYVFPPLGNIEGFAKVFSILAFFLAVFFSYHYGLSERFAIKNQRIKALVRCLIAFFLSGFVFVVLTNAFVKIVVIGKDKEVAVSVGFERRAEIASSVLKDANDEEILKRNGFEESSIHEVWTIRSLVVVRAGLFISYFLCLLAALFGCCLAVQFDLIDRSL